MKVINFRILSHHYTYFYYCSCQIIDHFLPNKIKSLNNSMKTKKLLNGLWSPVSSPKSTISLETQSNVETGISQTIKVSAVFRSPCLIGLDAWRIIKIVSTPWQNRQQMGRHRSLISRKVLFHQLRTDNIVKNHFYSKLRKSMRRMNKIINKNFKKEFKELNIKIIYKVIEAF